jgi:ParB family chromosome partitioning protein
MWRGLREKTKVGRRLLGSSWQETTLSHRVAFSLVNLVGRASAANILGITVRALDKLVDIYELSEQLKNLPEPGASITWAREIKNLNKNLLTPTILNTIIRRINNKEITNSKDIRKLRQILKDPVAREKFMSGATIEDALRVVDPSPLKKGQGILGDLEELGESIKRYPWTTLAELRGDQNILKKLDETEQLIKELRRALAK